MRAGPGLMRTTLCSVETAGCILTWERPQSTLTVLGRNQCNFKIYFQWLVVCILKILVNACGFRISGYAMVMGYGKGCNG